MLPPEERLPGVRALVDSQSYFVLHTPRQIGKTTVARGAAEAVLRGTILVARRADEDTQQQAFAENVRPRQPH